MVFAFDEKPASEGGRYLGEFKVTEATADSPAIKLTPNLPLNDAQGQRLAAAAKDKWTLYTTMPRDDAQPFVDLDDAARQAMLPPESVGEYAKADRQLHDYYTIFHEDFVQRGLLSNAIDRVQTNVARTEAATQEAVREAGYRDAEKGNLQSDLEGFQSEVKAIAAYQTSLETLLADVRQRLKDTYVENRRAAATLTSEQLKAAEEIDRRTRAATQASR